MPIYEYQCADCGHRFEKLQKVSEDPVRDCPECQAPEVRKLVSQSAFILKGAGWYKDHYGLKKGGGSSESSAGSTGGAAASASGTAPAAAPAASATPAASSAPSSSSSAASSASGA